MPRLVAVLMLVTHIWGCEGAPAKLTVQPVGQVKEYYKKGEFLPELIIHLEDKYGNAVRVPQVMMVDQMNGCEAQKNKFKYVAYLLYLITSLALTGCKGSRMEKKYCLSASSRSLATMGKLRST